jgi:hypothetical protein
VTRWSCFLKLTPEFYRLCGDFHHLRLKACSSKSGNKSVLIKIGCDLFSLLLLGRAVGYIYINFTIHLRLENTLFSNVRYSYGSKSQFSTQKLLYLQLFKNRIVMIQLHDKQFVPFISAKEIEFAITKMVQQVEDDFIDETPVFIGVLNGSLWWFLIL